MNNDIGYVSCNVKKRTDVITYLMNSSMDL